MNMALDTPPNRVVKSLNSIVFLEVSIAMLKGSIVVPILSVRNSSTRKVY